MDVVKKPTILCELAYKYGTDKCPRLKHNYTPTYYGMFKDIRQSVKKVLEMGIGYYKTIREAAIVYDKGLKRYYHRGASLKMWRDFFPNARIYGADIAPDTLFEDKRITTFLCDETKKKAIEDLVRKTGSDIDIFIDDGSHKWHHQLFLAQTILPLLKKDVIYIIEDVGMPRQVIEGLGGYECSIPKLPIKNGVPEDRLVLVKKK